LSLFENHRTPRKSLNDSLRDGAMTCRLQASVMSHHVDGDAPRCAFRAGYERAAAAGTLRFEMTTLDVNRIDFG
jgi:hypothetical protein